MGGRQRCRRTGQKECRSSDASGGGGGVAVVVVVVGGGERARGQLGEAGTAKVQRARAVMGGGQAGDYEGTSRLADGQTAAAAAAAAAGVSQAMKQKWKGGPTGLKTHDSQVVAKGRLVSAALGRKQRTGNGMGYTF